MSLHNRGQIAKFTTIMANCAKNLEKADGEALNEAGFIAKTAGLNAAYARQPPVGGFSNHTGGFRGGIRTAQQSFVRYAVLPGGNMRESRPHVYVWMVPVAPYLIEKGAQPHDIVTTWGRGHTPRTLHHPGVPARPFWSDAMDMAGKASSTVVLSRARDAVVDAFRGALF